MIFGLSGLCAESATYTITEIGQVAGRSSSVARGVNGAGHVVGRSGTPANSNTNAFIWSGGQPVSLGVLPGGDFSEAAGLNDVDDVAGSSNTVDRVRAVRWTNAQGIEDLGTLPGDVASQAFGINSRGAVVGFSTGPNGTRAVIWARNSYGRASPRPCLEANSAKQCRSTKEETSSVVQSIIRQNSCGSATQGTIRDLGVFSSDLDSDAFAINSSGQIVGSSEGPTGTTAVLWDTTAGPRTLGTLPGGNFSQALGINAPGAVVGISNNADGESHAFVWSSSDGMRDLNDLIPVDSDVLLVAAVGINARGQIVAFGGLRARTTTTHRSRSTC